MYRKTLFLIQILVIPNWQAVNQNQNSCFNNIRSNFFSNNVFSSPVDGCFLSKTFWNTYISIPSQFKIYSLIWLNWKAKYLQKFLNKYVYLIIHLDLFIPHIIMFLILFKSSNDMLNIQIVMLHEIASSRIKSSRNSQLLMRFIYKNWSQ